MAWYNGGKQRILNAAHAQAIDLVGDTIKVALMTSSYTFDPSTAVHQYWSEVVIDEINSSVTNYTTGGAALASKAITADDVSDRAEFDADPQVFTNIGNGTNDAFTQIIIYKDSGTPSSSPLIAHAITPTTTTTGSTITLEWDAEGILQFA